MRAHNLLLTLLVGVACAQGAFAQDSAPAKSDAQAPTVDESTRRVEQRIDRIHVEDNGAKVDEVRVGGQTKSITVQPKGRAPEYEITPTDGARTPPAQRQGAESNTGPRVWNVMKF